MRDADSPKPDYDVLVVGAGFAGMYMLHRLRAAGFRARVLEAGKGVGGTWYWNRYPGARCDIESMQYSYQFSKELEQEWEWTERYAAQPELLRYANHVADRFDLRRDISFDTRVRSASYSEDADAWSLISEDGQSRTASFVVMATGCLSSINWPKIAGLQKFVGKTYHTGEWPHEGVDFTGRRVAIIGTGSSSVQSIPIIAGQAQHLYVFQRTPNYSVPAQNRPMDPAEAKRWKDNYPELRAKAKQTMTGILADYSQVKAFDATEQERRQEYQRRWDHGGLFFMGAFMDLLVNGQANDTAAAFVHEKIREKVKDPKTAAALTPSNIIGGKRLCVDIGYFETFNRPNVTLVDINHEPIETVVANGVKTGERVYEVDDVVLATGFDAMTGALSRIEIKGRGGRLLTDKWAEGPRTYLGLGMAGFPNLFTVTGPGSPSVLSNMLPTIEQHVDWIADCLVYLRSRGMTEIEATTAAEDSWVDHVREVAEQSLRSTTNSWYLGANIPGKPRVFMPYIGGLPRYIAKCDEVVANGYEGFALA